MILKPRWISKKPRATAFCSLPVTAACIGWIGLQDATRTEAKEALTDLLDSGVQRVAMVSGDRQPVAARVAAEIGCGEVVAECLPQNKVDYVTDLKSRGYRVAVIGDGVNDALH